MEVLASLSLEQVLSLKAAVLQLYSTIAPSTPSSHRRLTTIASPLTSNTFIEGCSHKIRRQIEDLEKVSGILSSSLTVDVLVFKQGVNYAVAGATALSSSVLDARGIINPLTIASLGVQLEWFKESLPSICGNTSVLGDSQSLLIVDGIHVQMAKIGDDLKNSDHIRNPMKEKILLNVNSGRSLRSCAIMLVILFSRRIIFAGLLLQTPSLHDHDQRDMFCFYLFSGKLVNGPYLCTPENRDKQKLKDVRMPKDGDNGFFLITGSSNSTLDKIVLHLLRTGVCDENDRAYTS
ncbi:hypothetical protein Tco_0132792 [Tanacetum coccineum]